MNFEIPQDITSQNSETLHGVRRVDLHLREGRGNFFGLQSRRDQIEARYSRGRGGFRGGEINPRGRGEGGEINPRGRGEGGEINPRGRGGYYRGGEIHSSSRGGYRGRGMNQDMNLKQKLSPKRQGDIN